MKQYLVIIVCALTGCASFSTKQIDSRKESDGTSTEIVTIVKSRTLFTSKSDLTKFKASQTERQQGAEVGSLGQQSSGTNAVEALRTLDSILSKLPR